MYTVYHITQHTKLTTKLNHCVKLTTYGLHDRKVHIKLAHGECNKLNTVNTYTQYFPLYTHSQTIYSQQLFT